MIIEYYSPLYRYRDTRAGVFSFPSSSKRGTEAYELRYVARDCVPGVVLPGKDDSRRRQQEEKKASEWKSPRAADAERKRERVRVDKANGHFVKFAEQETTRITVRAPRRFRSLRHYPAACRRRNHKRKCRDATSSLSSLRIVANLDNVLHTTFSRPLLIPNPKYVSRVLRNSGYVFMRPN